MVIFSVHSQPASQPQRFGANRTSLVYRFSQATGLLRRPVSLTRSFQLVMREPPSSAPQQMKATKQYSLGVASIRSGANFSFPKQSHVRTQIASRLEPVSLRLRHSPIVNPRRGENGFRPPSGILLHLDTVSWSHNDIQII